jgi:nicotinate-nucleotide adenylyltransferase
MHKKIGLFFGSFNPIHIGHLLLATHMREAAVLDEIWFIVSPQNPFKKSSELADEQHRLEMVNWLQKR